MHCLFPLVLMLPLTVQSEQFRWKSVPLFSIIGGKKTAAAVRAAHVKT